MSNKMSPISFFSLHLELIRSGVKMGDGTGFIYKPDGNDQNFLLTNYHVLTAKQPGNPDILLPGCEGSPDEIRFSMLSKNDHQPVYASFSLPQKGEPIWLEHEHRKQGVDIVAIPVELPQDGIVLSQQDLGLADDMNFEVGSDLFIVGFPFGYAAGDFFPIWKRGTVASEPLFKPNGLSRFYVDAFTKPGMSGSPVFAMETRELFPVEGDTAKLFKDYEQGEVSALDVVRNLEPNSISRTELKKCFQLVGIYSGRIMVPGNQDPNIGIVWQKELIDEIFMQ